MAAHAQALEALCDYAKRSLPLQHCTVSSDAFGSMPVFDASSGKLVSYDVSPTTLSVSSLCENL